MKIHYVDATHYLFGGKRDVWGNTAHITETGINDKGQFHTTTMCGRPMLSSNWVAIQEVKEAGCPECLKLYNTQQNENNTN